MIQEYTLGEGLFWVMMTKGLMIWIDLMNFMVVFHVFGGVMTPKMDGTQA